MHNTILMDAVPAAGASGLGSNPMMMIGLMLVVVFFFMILPQMKKSKETKKFREAMAAGDRVVTAGGIHGKIRDVKDQVITLEIAENVRIKIEKSSIFSSVKEEDGSKLK